MSPSALRFTGAIAAAVLVVGALVACTPNRPNAAAQWLSTRAGVIEVEIAADHSDAFSSSGIVRGELEPDLAEEELDRLVEEVMEYVAEHESVGIRLGRDGVDFAVGGAEYTATGRELWRRLSSAPDILTGVAGGSSVHARVLRTHAGDALDALAAFGADLELEAFRNETAAAADRVEDDFTGGVGNLGALAVVVASGCRPDASIWAFVHDLIEQDAVDGAELDPCRGFEVFYRPDADLSAAAVGIRDRLAAAGAEDFPVKVQERTGPVPDGHVIVVTPGDPAALGVTAVLEAPGAPELTYVLDADRNLEVISYTDSPSDVLALVAGSPLAAALPSIALYGATVSARGTLAELEGFIDEATALLALDEEFASVHLESDSIRISLTSPVGTDPDMVAAAAALRANPIWTTHEVHVNYLNYEVLIADGTATLGSEDYVGGEMMDEFVSAWNAGAP